MAPIVGNNLQTVHELETEHEQTALLAEAHPRRTAAFAGKGHRFSVLRKVGVCCFAVGAVAWIAAGKGSTASSNLRLQMDTDAGTIEVKNEYGGQPPSMSYYDFGPIVEPFRITTITVVEDSSWDSAEDWTWKVTNLDTGNTTDIAGGPSKTTTHVFNSTGGESYEIAAYSATLGKKVTRNFLTKYVRRELRKLNAADAQDYLFALQTVYTTRNQEGKSEYGPNFVSNHWFGRWHLGSNSEDSPWHGAPSFFTAHAYLGSKFERAMQAVVPKTALHFWDFTIDAQMERWSDSFYWSTNWFGPLDIKNTSDTKKRVQGRFHDVQLMRNVTTTRPTRRTVNSYGIVTAPWNNNPGVYITRSFSVCGVSTLKMKLPGCSELKDSLEQTDMTLFHGIVEGYFHSQFHKVFGGSWECAVDLLEDLSGDDVSYTYTLANLALDIASLVDTLYYTADTFYSCPDYCSLETPFEECQCIDSELTSVFAEAEAKGKEVNATLVKKLFKSRVVEKLSWKTGNLNKALSFDSSTGQVLIDGYSESDSLNIQRIYLKMLTYAPKTGQFATPLASEDDPIFWPLHVNMELLWQYMRLAKNLNSSWFGHEPSCGDDCMYGWGFDEPLTPFDDAYGIRTDAKGKYYTNRQLVGLFAPEKHELPYVFDDFSWPACD